MTNRRYAGRILMIRNKSLGKRLLAAGIMLIFSMSGCGTDNKIELTGNGIGSDGIEAAATVDSAEVAAAGETASDVTGGDAQELRRIQIKRHRLLPQRLGRSLLLRIAWWTGRK